VVYDFVVMKLGQTAGEEFDEADKANIYWTIEAALGSTVSKTFTAPIEPGVYQLVCGVPEHFMAGMSGKITVVAP